VSGPCGIWRWSCLRNLELSSRTSRCDAQDFRWSPDVVRWILSMGWSTNRVKGSHVFDYSQIGRFPGEERRTTKPPQGLSGGRLILDTL
jgi:hypothetical protein